MKNIGFYITIILASFLVACTSETVCRKDMTVLGLVTLEADSMRADDRMVRYTSWDSVTVRAIDNEMYILYNNKSISKIPLPLRPDTNLTAFLLTYHGQTDTLFVEHTPREYFVNLACGCAVYHTITNAWSTDSRVDSVQIINASVENALQENLRIHLHE